MIKRTYKVDIVLESFEDDMLKLNKLLTEAINARLQQGERIIYTKSYDLDDQTGFQPGQDDTLFLKKFFNL